MEDLKNKMGGKAIVAFSASYIAFTHTILAYTAFISALIIGSYLHYLKIVQNGIAGWPDEWFPSVSATIGDWYPERNIFQIAIAISSGPRFALVLFWYLLSRSNNPHSTLPLCTLLVGILRTLSCGGWVYITSSDDHDWHDVFMISYLILCIPWMGGVIIASKDASAKSEGHLSRALKYRKRVAALFFGTLVPLIYFFIQHKVQRIPGAYTYYAFLEWSLIIYDIGFDAITMLDFNRLEVRIVDVGNLNGGIDVAGPFNIRVSSTLDPKRASQNGAIDKKREISFDWHRLLSYVVDVQLSIQFWTILTSLGLCVWYFPLWHMGLSGYEAFVMTTLSPILLGISPLKRICSTKTCIGMLHLSSIIGLYAYRYEQPEWRLSLVGIGVSFTCLALAAQLHAEADDPAKLQERGVKLILGLIGSSLLKFMCRSNNPFWPIMRSQNGGHNITGITLGFLASLEYLNRTEEKRTPIEPAEKDRLQRAASSYHGSSLLSACGLASSLFVLHALLSDSGTIITWVWGGYPIRGPTPVPHGALTLCSMCCAVVASIRYPQFCRYTLLFAIFGAILLNFVGGWIGYCGGLLFALQAVLALPHHVQTASQHPPGRTFFFTFLIYNVMVLASVWVVAYAFVPGGPYLRERTWLLLVVLLVFSGIGLLDARTLKWDIQRAKMARQNDSRPQKFFSAIILGTLALLSIGTALHRLPRYPYQPYHPQEKAFSAGIWTVHFGLDNGMWDSNYRIRDLIRDMELDVIGLLESDLQRIIMGNRDMTQFLGEELGMYTDVGPGPNKHTWGAALLSKFPILNSTHHLLPSPNGELAPAIHATLDVYGTEVDVIVSHNGQEEDPLDRELQTKALAKLMSDRYPRPFVFLGYVVTKPLEGNYHYLINDGRMKDVDPTDWDRWCQYIAYRSLKRVGYARVSRGTITDTELQVAKFQILPHDTDYAAIADETHQDRMSEEEVMHGLRFPDVFKGRGIRGHRYHVFNEPRYFN